MKNVLLIFILCIATYSYAQGEDELHERLPVLKFDFEKPHRIKIPSSIKEGDFYRIWIKNINLNQYNVIINKTDTVYSKPLVLPSLGNIDLSSVTSLIASIATEYSVVGKKALTSLDGKKEIDETVDKNAKVVEEIIEDELLFTQKKDTKKELVVKQLSKNKLHSVEFAKDILQIKDLIDKKEFQYMEYRVMRKSFDNGEIEPIKLKEDFVFFKKTRLEVEQLIDSITSSITEAKAFVEKTKGIKAFLNKTKNITQKEAYEKSQKELKSLIDKAHQLKGLIATKNVEPMLTSILSLYRENGYKSLPIQFTGEQAKLEMSFVPKDSASMLQSYRLFPIRFPKKERRWSVGTSLYYSGMARDRVGFETLQVNDSTTKFKVLQEIATNGELGTAVFVRHLILSNTNFKSYFAIGTGVSLTEEVLPRALLGYGFSFGKKHSFAVDGGFSIGNTKVVSDNIDFDKEYLEKPDVFINKIKVSYYVAVGYAYWF